jgi:phosphoglycerate dehydrogenase-like enzyme
MPTKVVVMAGRWAEWVDDYNAVSPEVNAVAAHTVEALMDEIASADVVFGRLPKDAFLRAKNLKWVQSIGVGFETMLYPEMIDSDVIITNTAGAFDSAMAEHAIALMLSQTRSIVASERLRKDRTYTRELPLSQVDGRRACVLGLGTIGRNIAIRLHALGLHVIGVDAQVTEPPEGVDELETPDQSLNVISKADFVLVALPLTDTTRGLVNAQWFDAMPTHAYLINIARGPIVNESDLVDALKEGKIAGAGIDVFEVEPLPKSSPLWDEPKAIITYHLGGRSSEGERNMKQIFCENLRRWIKGDPLLNLVDKRKGYVVQHVGP